jgi:hypothetical protein
VDEAEGELAELVAEAMGAEGDLVPERLARGCRCFAVVLEDLFTGAPPSSPRTAGGGRLAGYGWLTAGPEWIGELGLGIDPAAGSAYVWNCVTLPGDRRRGLFRALLQGVVGTARSEGLQRLWIGSIDRLGESAVAAAGFTPVLDINLWELGPLRWLAISPHAGADAGVVAGLRESLGGGRGALRSGPLYWRPRRH